MIKKYLPSKKFTIITVSFLVVLVIIALILFSFSKKENFKNKKTAIKPEDQSIMDFIQIDTDFDSIPDWEESLWGTDKNKPRTFDNLPDKTYIENKKKELNIEQEQDNRILTETDKFAREFFIAYTALKSSGDVDKSAIDSFSNALGQRIVEPALINKYSEENIKKTETDNKITRNNYYQTIKEFFDNYKEEGLGEELNIVNNSLISYNSTGQGTKQNKLNDISEAYKNFAKEVINTKVPESLIKYHLQIANNANNLGISVSNMAEVINDPVVGLSGLSRYQKYSDNLIVAVEKLEKSL